MNRQLVGLIVLILTACAALFGATPPISEVVAPEPGSIVLMAMALAGGAGYLIWKRRRQYRP